MNLGHDDDKIKSFPNLSDELHSTNVVIKWLCGQDFDRKELN